MGILFNKLPKEIQQLALEERNKQGLIYLSGGIFSRSMYLYFREKPINRYDNFCTIDNCFHWRSSRQGYRFLEQIHNGNFKIFYKRKLYKHIAKGNKKNNRLKIKIKRVILRLKFYIFKKI